MLTLNVATQQHSQLLPITDAVSQAVADSGVTDGTCTLYCLRTTAALTINENAVSDVVRDVLLAVDKLIPWDAPEYCHVEENSAAHVKAASSAVPNTSLSATDGWSSALGGASTFVNSMDHVDARSTSRSYRHILKRDQKTGVRV